MSPAFAELGASPTMTWKSAFSAWTSLSHDPAGQSTTRQKTDLRIGYGGLCNKNGNIARNAQTSRRTILSHFPNNSKRVWMLLCVPLASFSWYTLSKTKFSWVSLRSPLQCISGTWQSLNPACRSGLLAKSHGLVSFRAHLLHVAGSSDSPMFGGSLAAPFSGSELPKPRNQAVLTPRGTRGQQDLQEYFRHPPETNSMVSMMLGYHWYDWYQLERHKAVAEVSTLGNL